MERKVKKNPYKNWIVLITTGSLLLVGAFVIVLQIQGQKNRNLLANKDRFYKGIYVEDISLEGFTLEEAKEKLIKEIEADCSWSMEVTFQGKAYQVADIVSCNLEKILSKAILIGHKGSEQQRLKEIHDLKKNSLRYTIEGMYQEDDIIKEVKRAAKNLNEKPINAELSGYSESTQSFLFHSSAVGYEVDQEYLKDQIKQALVEKRYDARIEVTMIEIQPEWDEAVLKDKVKLLSEFSTNTTSNIDRNSNITLASQAINGLILKPGEEFSMNKTTGPRTIEQGYKPAGAILNGKLVEEPGGGVCQVSTTLYNAVVKAGLRTTQRFSHSLEPVYINLGEDSMVSYPNADLKFKNNTKSSVLVRTTFKNRVLKVLVYGMPVLEEGVTVEMFSEVSQILPKPETVYEENPTLKYGEERVISSGKEGKKVVTYLVTKNNGQEIKREFLHNSTYKGKNSIIQRNSKAKPPVEKTVTPSPLPTKLPKETKKPQGEDLQEKPTKEPVGSPSQSPTAEPEI